MDSFADFCAFVRFVSKRFFCSLSFGLGCDGGLGLTGLAPSASAWGFEF